jgi:hypothetical protein
MEMGMQSERICNVVRIIYAKTRLYKGKFRYRTDDEKILRNRTSR